MTGPGWRPWFLALAAALAAAGPCLAAAQPRLAVLPIELYDTSLEGETLGANPVGRARIAMVERELRQSLETYRRFALVNAAPAAAKIEQASHLRSCRGCEVPIVAGLGADLALTGWVQKVSNLIPNINLTVRDVATRELVFAGGASIRGTPDESWRHGIRYLLNKRLPKE